MSHESQNPWNENLKWYHVATPLLLVVLVILLRQFFPTEITEEGEVDNWLNQDSDTVDQEFDAPSDGEFQGGHFITIACDDLITSLEYKMGSGDTRSERWRETLWTLGALLLADKKLLTFSRDIGNSEPALKRWPLADGKTEITIARTAELIKEIASPDSLSPSRAKRYCFQFHEDGLWQVIAGEGSVTAVRQDGDTSFIARFKAPSESPAELNKLWDEIEQRRETFNLLGRIVTGDAPFLSLQDRVAERELSFAGSCIGAGALDTLRILRAPGEEDNTTLSKLYRALPEKTAFYRKERNAVPGVAPIIRMDGYSLSRASEFLILYDVRRPEAHPIEVAYLSGEHFEEWIKNRSVPGKSGNSCGSLKERGWVRIALTADEIGISEPAFIEEAVLLPGRQAISISVRHDTPELREVIASIRNHILKVDLSRPLPIEDSLTAAPTASSGSLRYGIKGHEFQSLPVSETGFKLLKQLSGRGKESEFLYGRAFARLLTLLPKAIGGVPLDIAETTRQQIPFVGADSNGEGNSLLIFPAVYQPGEKSPEARIEVSIGIHPSADIVKTFKMWTAAEADSTHTRYAFNTSGYPRFGLESIDDPKATRVDVYHFVTNRLHIQIQGDGAIDTTRVKGDSLSLINGDLILKTLSQLEYELDGLR